MTIFNAELTSVNESKEVEAILSSALAESQSALEYHHMSLLTLLMGLDDHPSTAEIQ